MNITQKIIFMATVVCNTLMGLFPPWHSRNAYGMISHRGYHFIFTPPNIASISITTLIVQIGIATFLGISMWYYFKTQGQPKTTEEAKKILDNIELK